MLKVKSWLPMFEGFYGTHFDISENDTIINNLNDSYLLKDYELEYLTDKQKEIIKNNCWDTESYNNAEQDYRIEVINTSIGTIKRELKGYVNNIELEALVSPKEYNFANDSINCTYELSPENIEAIKGAINNNIDKWDKYITDKYMPCSGFIPYYDNDITSEDWNIAEAIEHDHKLGVILEFILTEVLNYTRDNYINDVLENVYFSPYLPEIVKELIEKDILIVGDEQKHQKELKDNNMQFNFKGVM